MKRPFIITGLLLVLICIASHSAIALISDTTRVDLSVNSIPYISYEDPGNLLIVGSSGRLLDPVEIPPQNIPDSVHDKRRQAHALLQKVLDGQRFLESLDALSEIELPVGVVKAGGAVDYSILVDRIQFTKEGALMDVYVSLSLPQTGARIAFHGSIPLSAQGGIAGNARVYLLGDHPIKLNNTTLITVKGTDASYVEFDCTGFLGVNLDAELEFSTDLIRP